MSSDNLVMTPQNHLKQVRIPAFVASPDIYHGEISRKLFTTFKRSSAYHKNNHPAKSLRQRMNVNFSYYLSTNFNTKLELKVLIMQRC